MKDKTNLNSAAGLRVFYLGFADFLKNSMYNVDKQINKLINIFQNARESA